MKQSVPLFIALLLAPPAVAPSADAAEDSVTVKESTEEVVLSNQSVVLRFDLAKRTYSMADTATGEVVIQDACMRGDGWGERKKKKDSISEEWPDWTLTHSCEDVMIGSGKGKRLVVSMENKTRPAVPAYLFSYTLGEGSGVVTMGFGATNQCDHDCRLMSAYPMHGAKLALKLKDPLTLNGSAGAEPAEVTPGLTRVATRWRPEHAFRPEAFESPNSLMLTGLSNGSRRTIVWGGLANKEFAKYAGLQNGVLECGVRDPVGRLVGKGETYWSEDNLYVDITGGDCFSALERYGRAMREANHASPNVYDFPVLCGWGVGNLSKLPGVNNSAKLVGELEAAQKAGVTKYTKVAIRLEPDTGCYANGNTEQGWWDDEHWAKHRHLVPPYETFAKWCAAINARDGIPYTYIQVGMPSDDYARAFPGHMLFKDISRLSVKHMHHQPLVSYDYTAPDFQKHTRATWERLRQEGIRGIKFDYPETGWRPEGGFENRQATTAFAYREAFRLCREGLGKDAFLDERNLGESDRPCLDVTAGLVDTQRNWRDSNKFVPGMITIGGLRWYKNRTVFNYYPDSKTVHDCPPEIRRSMLTMVYLTSGRIDLATSFTLFTPEIVHDFTRIYPAYREPFTARPLDAFTGVKDPQVYDLELTPDWHQIALYNSSPQAAEISVPLSGDRVRTGAVGLDAAAEFYAYEFWGDRLLGRFSGTQTISAQLEPSCCAMIAVRKVQPNPQVLSTSRHVLQGWVDLADTRWNAENRTLGGTAKVVAGEAFRIALANNGLRPRQGAGQNASARLEQHPAGDGYAVLVLDAKETGDVAWQVRYGTPREK